MIYDLNGNDKDMPVLVLDFKAYLFNWIQNIDEIKKMIDNISDQVDVKSQWLPIARKILEPFNDVNELSIENEEQLIKFINFISLRLKDASNQ
jgi:hypothetical protein